MQTLLTCLIGILVLGTVRATAFPVEVSQAPGNEVALLLHAIQSAHDSLYINIYELKSEEVAEALVNRVQGGLHVEILEEGQPVGGLSDSGSAIRARLIDAMSSASANAQDHFYVMTAKPESRAERRYHFDHAKYLVLDESALLLGSENYSGQEAPSTEHPGNRGWEVLVHDASLARQFLATFHEDADCSQGDVFDEVNSSQTRPRLARAAPLPFLPLPNQTLQADRAERILSPHSLAGLSTLIDGARKTIELELMAFSSQWGATGEDSPLLLAVEAAARRGVRVRVLLNDETVFQHPHSRTRKKNHNLETVGRLNRLAEDEGLDLQARIADVEAMQVSYIHNKGALVDGERVLVSSINWNQNSVENNREAALVLYSQPIFAFYDQLFAQDWAASGDTAAPGSVP